jgi:hypothetical protein
VHLRELRNVIDRHPSWHPAVLTVTRTPMVRRPAYGRLSGVHLATDCNASGVTGHAVESFAGAAGARLPAAAAVHTTLPGIADFGGRTDVDELTTLQAPSAASELVSVRELHAAAKPQFRRDCFDAATGALA